MAYDFSTEIFNECRELYQQFVDLIVEIFSATKTGRPIEDLDLLSQLFNFHKKYILYTSLEVINSFSYYFQYLYSIDREEESHDAKVHFKKLSKIMKNMRTDLGLSNKNLGHDRVLIFRDFLTDFNKTFKQTN